MTQTTPDTALSGLSPTLRGELFSEYSDTLRSFYESRWRECGLAAGRFCEAAFTIIPDLANGTVSQTSLKPRDFVGSCRKLESDKRLPDGIRIHALKLLPVIYDIRNRRDIGHINGDVDPSLMDANLCVSSVSWIFAEFVRVHHTLSTAEAQRLVTMITEIKTPLIWDGGDIRRVTKTGISRSDEALLLISSIKKNVSEDNLLQWMGIKQRSNLRRVLDKMHDLKLIEAKASYGNLRIMPLGSKRLREILSE